MTPTHTHPEVHVLPTPAAPLPGGDATHMQMKEGKPAATGAQKDIWGRHGLTLPTWWWDCG